MAETKNLMIVSISAEPKQTAAGKPFWISVDSDDTEWLCWNQEIADAVRERKLKETDYYINVSEKGDKTYRSIQGIPGVIEPQKRSGGGGERQFIPRDPQAEEQAKWPSFALSYAKDVHIAQGDFTPGRITKTATEFMEWLNKYRQAPKVEPKSEGDTAQRVQDRGTVVPPAEPPSPVEGQEQFWADFSREVGIPSGVLLKRVRMHEAGKDVLTLNAIDPSHPAAAEVIAWAEDAARNADPEALAR